MCDVKPLLACQRQVKELEAQIAELTKPEPIPPIPQITKWGIQRHYVVQYLETLGIGAILEDEPLILDSWYYYTSLEDWGKILYDLVFSSELYNPVFDCDKYATNAYIQCCLKYQLNTLLLCLGKYQGKGHGFNLFPYGDETGLLGVKLWEPSDGFPWSGEPFEIGENEYRAQIVLI
jgi:hypothetical protein